jgi:DNA-binding beta-propeller fold protein YncE
VAVAPGALQQDTMVRITPLRQDQLSQGLPEGFRFGAALRLDMGDDTLNSRVELAVPAPGVAPGTRVYFFRADSLTDETGADFPVWMEEEVGVVGSDGFARTTSTPYPGLRDPGEILMGLAEADIGHVEGSVGTTPPRGALDAYRVFGFVSPAQGGIPIAAVSQTNTVITMDLPAVVRLRHIDILIQPQQGLPKRTTVGVQLDPTKVSTFATVVDTASPGAKLSDLPHITDVSLQFLPDPRSPGSTDLIPQVVIKGDHFLYDYSDDPGIPPAKRVGRQIADLTVGFTRPGALFPIKLTPLLGSTATELHVAVEPTIVLGLADIRVNRPQTIKAGRGMFRQITVSSKTVRLTPDPRYVFAALSGNQVAAIDMRTNALAARIPVGEGATFPGPRAVAVTPDGTRAYVTLRFDHAVAVIDTMTLREVDNFKTPTSIPGVIELPPDVTPFWIAIDPQGRWAYVSDEGKGRIYAINVDPASPSYNSYKPISIPKGDVSGLRGLDISADGKRLYVAEPGSETLFHQGFPPPTGGSTTGFVEVIDVDPTSRTFRSIVGTIPAALEPYGVTASTDPLQVAFTDRLSNTVQTTKADATEKSWTPSSIGLDLGPPTDYFAVNNPQGIALTKNRQWAFVTGFNQYVRNSASADPDVNPTKPGGSTVGIIFNPFGLPGLPAPFVVAATRPIPFGFPDNLVLSPDEHYLYVAYRGIGAVFVYDVQAIFRAIADPANEVIIDPVNHFTLLQIDPVNDLVHGVTVPNAAIDVRADYRLVVDQFGRPAFGVPTGSTRAPIATGGLPGGLADQVRVSALLVQGAQDYLFYRDGDHFNLKYENDGTTDLFGRLIVGGNDGDREFLQGLPATGDVVTFKLRPGESRTIRVDLKALDTPEMREKTKQNTLYGAVIYVSGLDDKGDDIYHKDVFVYRLFDVGDNNHSDGLIEIEKTFATSKSDPLGHVVQNKRLFFVGPDSARPRLDVLDKDNFDVVTPDPSKPNEMAIQFGPIHTPPLGDEGLVGSTIRVLVPDPLDPNRLAGTINVQGTSVGKQRVLLPKSSFRSALARIVDMVPAYSFTEIFPPEFHSSATFVAMFPPSPPGLPRSRAPGFDSFVSDLYDKTVLNLYAIFAETSPDAARAIEFVDSDSGPGILVDFTTDFFPSLPTILEDGLASAPHADFHFTEFKRYLSDPPDANGLSVAQEKFLFDSLTNQEYSDSSFAQSKGVVVHLDHIAAFSDFYDGLIPSPEKKVLSQFPIQMANVLAHEVGHDLGAMHLRDAKNAYLPKPTGPIALPPGKFIGRIMAASDITEPLKGFGLLSPVVKFALGLPVTDQEVNDGTGSKLSGIWEYYRQYGPLEKGAWNEGSPGAPDFEVPGPSLDVFDKAPQDLSSASVGRSDLGTVVADGPGGAASTMTLYLFNTGNKALTITDVHISGGDGAFSVVGGPSTSRPVVLPALDIFDPHPERSTLAITVRFDPRAPGRSNAVLRITSNSIDDLLPTSDGKFDGIDFASHRSERDVPLTGLGVSPFGDGAVVVASHNAGGLKLSDPPHAVRGFATIRNQGAGPLTVFDIRVTAGADQFAVGGLPVDFGPAHPLVLAPGGSLAFDLFFAAKRLGLQHGTIQLFTSDPAAPVRTIGLLGTGLADEPLPLSGKQYVAVETPTMPGSRVLHLIIDAGADVVLDLPPDVAYHAVVFDPASGLVYHEYGLSAPAGERTVLLQPIFAASAQDDTVGDGLPDDVRLALGTSPRPPEVLPFRPLLLDTASAGTPSPSDPLTLAQLEPIVAEAKARWVAAAGHDLIALNSVEVRIAELPSGELGRVVGQTVWIDPRAGGAGWFIDPTPGDDAEFAGSPAAREFHAAPGSDAYGRVDLLTVVSHELGHVLGLSDLDAGSSGHDLMTTTLEPGVRHVPTPQDILDVYQGWVPSATGPATFAPLGDRSTGAASGPAFQLLNVVPSAAGSSGLRNGDFSVSDPNDPAFGWAVRGTGSIANGAALLGEDGRVFTGFSQTFIVPEGARTLRFTLQHTHLGNNDPFDPPDAFEAALLDAATGLPLFGAATGLTDTDAFLNVQTTGEVFFGPGVTMPGLSVSGQIVALDHPMTVTVDLSGVRAGTRVTLYFDLLGFGPATSSVMLSDVSLSVGSVQPPPPPPPPSPQPQPQPQPQPGPGGGGEAPPGPAVPPSLPPPLAVLAASGGTGSENTTGAFPVAVEPREIGAVVATGNPAVLVLTAFAPPLPGLAALSGGGDEPVSEETLDEFWPWLQEAGRGSAGDVENFWPWQETESLGDGFAPQAVPSAVRIEGTDRAHDLEMLWAVAAPDDLPPPAPSRGDAPALDAVFAAFGETDPAPLPVPEGAQWSDAAPAQGAPLAPNGNPGRWVSWLGLLALLRGVERPNGSKDKRRRAVPAGPERSYPW